jgi:hypothetical protein
MPGTHTHNRDGLVEPSGRTGRVVRSAEIYSFTMIPPPSHSKSQVYCTVEQIASSGTSNAGSRGLQRYTEILSSFGGGCLSSGVLEVGDEVLPVLLLLEATEGHLRAGDVLLGVLEVGEKSVVVPGDALLLVGVGVGVALDGAGLAAEEAVERGADLVTAASLDGVALRAARLEKVGTLLSVTLYFVSGCSGTDAQR